MPLAVYAWAFSICGLTEEGGEELEAQNFHWKLLHPCVACPHSPLPPPMQEGGARSHADKYR